MKTNKFSPFFWLACLPFFLFQPQKRVVSVEKTAFEQPEVQTICSLKNNVFQSGEEITYKLYYNWNFVWAAAGEVTFRVSEDEHQYHFTANGRTYKSYEWMYKVKDDYESWVDKNTLYPTYSTRSISEGGYSNYEKVLYKQAERKTQVWRAKKKDMPETETAHDVKDCVQDLVSMVYFLRNIDFSDKKVGDKANINVYLDQEEYPISIKYKGKDGTKNIRGIGKHKTLVFEPEIIAGNVFKEGDKMTIWVSDDENKIPLLIESPISVGSVKMILKTYNGLRFPFTAKVD